MGNWFGHGTHGAVLGLWSSCASVGNILGTMIASHALLYGYEVFFTIYDLCLRVQCFIIVTWQFCRAPISAFIPTFQLLTGLVERPKPVGFFRAWLLPGVLSYSLAYACLKMVNYSFFFWLPFYLHNNFHWEEAVADALSVWYDWGGILAAVLAGVLSDKCRSRTPIVVAMLAISMGALFAYAKSPKDIVINSLLMAVTGFFIGGPANLVSAAISADLGKAEEIRGSAEALSTVTGIVDGTGSIGASVGQILLPVIQNSAGWSSVFYMFILMIFLTVICLLPLMFKEIRSRRRIHYEALPEDDNYVQTSVASDSEPELDSDQSIRSLP
ncbi:unnamed protein product [Enterobius vermicularis]|uniref:MFS domain-containing protein n=1 Tax=Enterobius vermicularis TaxID=51028 RepID=A0A0N4VM92_ENTVE|nr:unnamed protein product [Enterobius vermicularis]